MKRLVTAALALSLLAGTAYAQDDHRDRGDGGRGGGGQAAPEAHQGGGERGRGGGPAAPQGQQGGPQGPSRSAPQQQQPQVQQQFRGQRGFGGPQGQNSAPQQQQPQVQQQFRGQRGLGGPQGQGSAPQQQQPQVQQQFRGQAGGQPGFDRNRGGAPQVNGARGGFQPGFRQGQVWRSPQRFRGPEYNFPRGFGYRVWGFGDYLPGPFFISDYVLYNYWAYGLPPPPPGYEWIRVGHDALMVQIGSGYVLDVASDLFW